MRAQLEVRAGLGLLGCGCRTSQEPVSRKVGPFQELEVSSGLATLLQGLGEITVTVFDLLYPASSSLSIFPSRSGWEVGGGYPPSNPSLEEMGDSHSGAKYLGHEWALSPLRDVRLRSVINPLLWPRGPACLPGASAYFILGTPEQRQHKESGMAERPPASPRHLPPCPLPG